VRAQRVAFGEARVLEIIGGRAGHAEFFHDAARAKVGGHGEGDHFRQRQLLEGVAQATARAFGGEAPIPMRGGQPPADRRTG
jgi:hypothetical protein